MKFNGRKFKFKSSSALVVAAGCTVAFMFLTTIISFILFQQRMNEANVLLKDAQYNSYDSYVVLITSNDMSMF